MAAPAVLLVFALLAAHSPAVAGAAAGGAGACGAAEGPGDESVALLQVPSANALRPAPGAGSAFQHQSTGRDAKLAPPRVHVLDVAPAPAAATGASAHKGLRGIAGDVATAASDLNRVVHDALVASLTDSFGQLMALGILSLVMQACLILILAHFYLDVVKCKPQTDMSLKGTDFSVWSSQLLRDFTADDQICLWSCFCPCIRWADTLHTAGVGRFWLVVGLGISGILLAECTMGLSLAANIAGLWLLRRRLRRRFGMHSESFVEVAADCAAVCCCLPCVVAQEARHVEAASLAGDPVVVMAWQD